MTDEDQIRAAAATVRSARDAVHAATERRVDKVTAARDLAEAAHAAERAEQDAARSAESAGIHRLAAAHLTTAEIAALCEIPPEEVHQLRFTDTALQVRELPVQVQADGPRASHREQR
jgi:hypothetical protein